MAFTSWLVVRSTFLTCGTGERADGCASMAEPAAAGADGQHVPHRQGPRCACGAHRLAPAATQPSANMCRDGATKGRTSWASSTLKQVATASSRAVAAGPKAGTSLHMGRAGGTHREAGHLRSRGGGGQVHRAGAQHAATCTCCTPADPVQGKARRASPHALQLA